MPPRLGPAPLTNAEKQRRLRADRRAYIAALEAAVRDATGYVVGCCDWHLDHATTIARARGATTTTATTED
jgi:hypothetical protein